MISACQGWVFSNISEGDDWGHCIFVILFIVYDFIKSIFNIAISFTGMLFKRWLAEDASFLLQDFLWFSWMWCNSWWRFKFKTLVALFLDAAWVNENLISLE